MESASDSSPPETRILIGSLWTGIETLVFALAALVTSRSLPRNTPFFLITFSCALIGPSIAGVTAAATRRRARATRNRVLGIVLVAWGAIATLPALWAFLILMVGGAL